jgi:hypothetical protein
VSGFRKFLDFMGNMGLMARADPPKVIDLTGREWGAPVDGFVLSVRQLKKEDPDQLAVVSVVLKNQGGEAKLLTIPEWLFFYQLGVLAPDGSIEPLSPYGRQLLRPERKMEKIELKLAPGGASETELPIGSLYPMRARGDYRVTVSCRLPDGARLTSNETIVRP